MRILKRIGLWLLALLLIVVIVIPGLVLYFLFLPVDMIRYYNSRYYKGTRRKFKPFIGSKNVVKIYNYISKRGLDIEYSANGKGEYFIAGGAVLISDPACDHFDQRNGAWVALEYGKEGEMPIEDFVSMTRAELNDEHREMPIKFIVGYGDNLDKNDFASAEERPYFACIGAEGVI